MTRTLKKRREFLQLLAQTGVLFPTFSSLFSGSKAFGATQPQKRFIFVNTANGQYAPHWYPDPGRHMIDMGDGARGFHLDGIRGPLSQIFNESFRRFYSKMNLVRGLDIIPVNGVRDHWEPKVLNCHGVQDEHHETIDQIMARSKAVYPGASPALPILYVKVKGVDYMPSARLSCYRRGHDIYPMDPIDNLALAKMSILGEAFENKKIKALLDGSYRDLLRETVLAKEDRIRLEAHLEQLASYNNSGLNLAGAQTSVQGEFVKLIATAIKTGKTKLGIFSLTETWEHKAYSQFSPTGFHELTHQMSVGNNVDALFNIQTFHAGFVRQLLEELDEVEDLDTGATFLDNSIVFWGGGLSVKPNLNGFLNIHSREDLPVCTFGSAAGYLKTGQYLDFRRPGQSKRYPYVFDADPGGDCNVTTKICEFDADFPGIGRPYNEFAITMMRAMGVDPSEWEINGVPGFGRYDENFEDQYDVSDKRSPIAALVA